MWIARGVEVALKSANGEQGLREDGQHESKVG